MAIFLDEDCVGRSKNVYFPNLQSCLSLSCVGIDQSKIIGAHLTIGTDEKIWPVMAKYMVQLLEGAKIQEIYCIGNLNFFKMHRYPELQYPRMIATFRNELGYGGFVKFFDLPAACGGKVGGMAYLSNSNGRVAARFWPPGAYQRGGKLEFGTIRRIFAGRGLQNPLGHSAYTGTGPGTEITSFISHKA
jgi:hypothetical protein